VKYSHEIILSLELISVAPAFSSNLSHGWVVADEMGNVTLSCLFT